MKVKSEREAAQSCPTVSGPMDGSAPGASPVGPSRREHWGGRRRASLPSAAKFKPQLRSHCFITLRKEVRLFAPFLSHL